MSHEIVEGLFGQKLGKDEIDSRIAASEVMDGLDSGVAGGGLQEVGEVFIAVNAGNVREELDGVFDVERGEVAGVKEAEEGLAAVGDAIEEALGGADGGEDGVVLHEGTPDALLALGHVLEEGVEVLHEHDESAVTEVPKETFTKTLAGDVGGLAVDALEVGGGEVLRVALADIAVDEDEELQEAGGRLVLVQPSEAELFREVGLLAQAMVDESDEMGFPSSARADEEKMVLVRGKDAFPHGGDAFL